MTEDWVHGIKMVCIKIATGGGRGSEQPVLNHLLVSGPGSQAPHPGPQEAHDSGGGSEAPLGQGSHCQGQPHGVHHGKDQDFQRSPQA